MSKEIDRSSWGSERPRRRRQLKQKSDELKTTVYVMEAVELYEPKESNK
jgi:hypothetical protein